MRETSIFKETLTRSRCRRIGEDGNGKDTLIKGTTHRLVAVRGILAKVSVEIMRKITGSNFRSVAGNDRARPGPGSQASKYCAMIDK